MGSRTFDPFFLEQIDQNRFDDRDDSTPEDELEPLSMAVICPGCGKADLVFEDDHLVELDGHAHECDPNTTEEQDERAEV